MKIFPFLFASAVLSFSAVAEASSPGFFVPNSRLAEGNWVKVGVDKSGIYEISYARLREMGFERPDMVGVFGRGGRQMALDFVDENGQRLNPDDLPPVAVFHHDGHLYFYGEGTETFTFEPDDKAETKGYFHRYSKNVYTDLGYYFLSDMEGARLDMSVADTNLRQGAAELKEGLSFISHEVDLEQNTSHTGQLFWGERFNGQEPSRREWYVSAPEAIAGRKAMMECYFYSERVSTGTLEWGIKGSEDIRSGATRNYNSVKFRPQDPLTHSTDIPGDSFFVYVDYKTFDNFEGVANLDFWTLTYPRTIPTLRKYDGSSRAQDHMAFVSLLRGGYVDMDGFPEGVLFDISDPRNPVVSHRFEKDGKMVAAVPSNKGMAQVIVADLSVPQMQIKGFSQDYSRVVNQDLHSLGEEGASLLIITTERLLPQAQRLARLHTERDGIRVAVATADQVYNEFSCGVPDPMAYRAFAKMLYESEGEKLRNILLLGPLFSDFRGVDVTRDKSNGLIAYQVLDCEPEKGAANANDILGIMSDRLPDSRIERCPVSVGVGILPCQTPEEVEAYVDKVEQYLSDDSFAYRLNKMLNIGGLGDRHTHDQQAVSLGGYLNGNNRNHLIVSPLVIDAYGSAEAKKRFRNALDEGVNLVTYFGHGGPTMMGKDRNFFSMADVGSLTNNHYPFMIFAGCILSNTDRGIRGIAEHMVLGHDSGLIGAVLATRDTWSGENMDLVKILYNRMFKNGNSVTSPPLERPLTIGEAYARAKNQSEYANELSYHLVCDPALIIPIATHSCELKEDVSTIYPGGKLRLSGNIADCLKHADGEFSGELVVRIMYPEKIMESPDLDTGSREDGDILTVPYGDVQAAAGASEVKDGLFSIELDVPSALVSAEGEDVGIYLSAYDPERRLGAASRLMVRVGHAASGGISRPDNVVPVIDDFHFDAEEKTLEVSVSDNSGFDTSSAGHLSSFLLTLDGEASGLGGLSLTRYSHEGYGFSKTIPVGWMSEGRHKAYVEVRDADGNVASRELEFTLGAEPRLLSLRLLGEAAREEALFETLGMNGETQLVITDSSGRRITSIPVSGDLTRWDLNDSEGHLVPPGLYRAFMREARGSADGMHSEAVFVPVVVASGAE